MTKTFEEWAAENGMTPVNGPIPSVCRKAFNAGRADGIEEAADFIGNQYLADWENDELVADIRALNKEGE